MTRIFHRRGQKSRIQETDCRFRQLSTLKSRRGFTKIDPSPLQWKSETDMPPKPTVFSKSHFFPLGKNDGFEKISTLGDSRDWLRSIRYLSEAEATRSDWNGRVRASLRL